MDMGQLMGGQHGQHHAQHDHKEQVEHHVDNARNGEEIQRALGIAHGAQNACADVVDHQADDTGKIDWRQGYGHELQHEIVTLPEHIQTFCREFLKRMHLNFGCFDFIVTPENKYVFLECNPNGQWMWIELITGCDISQIIAHNLAKYEPTQLD